MAVRWENTQHTSFTLWDIDREFQNANEAYQQWQARHRTFSRRAIWACLRTKNQDDALAKALSLGRQVQRLMEAGKSLYGARFEQGDSRCHAILSAQLLRLQYEVRQPLYDSALSPSFVPIPYDDIMTAARSIRRTCLTALREQFARYDSRVSVPILPPPRFKVDFCPFADQLRQDLREKKSSDLQTIKAKMYDRYDDREICPHCDACISVTAHSGLPDYRCILFTSHIAQGSPHAGDKVTFACKSCYKTFDDSYAFLDHVFQKQIGSEKSCLKPSTSGEYVINQEFLESDPSLVEQCLKNCLMRELTRAKTQKKLMMMSKITVRKVHPNS